MKDMNNQYIQNRHNRMKNSGHWRLAIGQIKQYPLLLILTIPIIALAIIIWVKMDFVFSVFDVPKMLLPAYIVTVKALGVIFPVLLLWGLVDVIGTLNAQKDEALIQMAFKEKELRNGSPILIYKRKDKKTGVTIREWYSPIPMNLWVERQEEIADAMNIHFVQNFRYGGKSNGNRIVMYSAEGREAISRGVLYDEEF
jgi:hypothetical protein